MTDSQALKDALSEIGRLSNELQLRADHGKDFREHLKVCNAEIFTLKNHVEELEKQLKELHDEKNKA